MGGVEPRAQREGINGEGVAGHTSLGERNYNIMKIVKVLYPLVLTGALIACSNSSPARDNPAAVSQPSPAISLTQAAPQARPRIVMLGDSLTAGYGLERVQSYPNLLQQHLDAEGYKYEVVNAGVSGDTSAGGLRRLDWSLDGDVRILVVALGGNDGLRGLPVDEMKRNLSTIITQGRQRGAAVILAGIEAPPNYGHEYTSAFRKTFRELADEHKIPLVPFLLDGVAGIPSLNIADGIHPNPEGAKVVERTVWRALEPLLDRSDP